MAVSTLVQEPIGNGLLRPHTSLFQALSQKGRSKKRARDERDLLPAFSIVRTDREPGTG